jgi:transposase InsO family protein
MGYGELGGFGGLTSFRQREAGFGESLKRGCSREKTPLSLEDAKRLIQQHVDHYNHVRLQSAIGT